MNEYKYTKDGKKVVVIGKLNNAEYIVQEIFVSNGQEIPGGENFVASGLLDTPSKSWKQKEAENWEIEYERLRTSLEKLRNTERFESNFTREVKQRLASYKDIEAIDQLLAFLNNEIEYIVMDSEIQSMLTAIAQSSDYRCFENLKLLTLFGDKKTGLNWKINRYSDGSGWNSNDIYPARSLDDAKQYLENKIKVKDSISESDIKAKEKYSLKYPSKSQRRKYQEGIIKSQKDAIKATEKKLAEQKLALLKENDK